MLYDKRTGSGKIIVFIHGNSQSSEIWDDLVAYPELTGYNLIRIDLPGHGRSSWMTHPEADYTFVALAQSLKIFLDSLTTDYLVVAHSLGANFIAEIIHHLPQCKGLFLTGATISGPDFAFDEIVKPNPHFGTLVNPAPDQEQIAGLINSLALRMTPQLTTYLKMFNLTDPRFRSQLGQELGQGRLGDEVGNLEVLNYPTAVVYGIEDQFAHTGYLNRTAIKLWMGSVIELPDAGHACHIDQPDRLAGLIAAYAAAIFRSDGS